MSAFAPMPVYLKLDAGFAQRANETASDAAYPLPFCKFALMTWQCPLLRPFLRTTEREPFQTGVRFANRRKPPQIAEHSRDSFNQ